MSIEFTNDQIYALYDLENWWNRQNEQVFEISGAPGTGKAQPLSTMIPIPDGGEKRLGDLKVGDYVFDEKGRATKILGIYPQGKKRVYEVTIQGGLSTKCCIEHLWAYYGSIHDKDLEIAELGTLMKKIKDSHIFIPINSSVHYAPFKKPFIDNIDHYKAGKNIGIMVNKLNILYDNIKKYVNNINCNRSKKLQKKIDNYILKYQDYKNKIIEIIEYGNFTDCGTEYERKTFLAGILDYCGTVLQSREFKDGVRLVFSTTIEELSYIIKKVFAGLGIQCISNTDKSLKIYDEKITMYEISPFSSLDRLKGLTRKSRIKSKIWKYNLFNCQGSHPEHMIEIIGIKDLGYEEEMCCICVNNPTHLYQTENFIVTHNTTIIRYFIERLDLKMDNIMFLAFMGKAATQMARNGLPGRTIHSAIYDYKEKIARDEEGHIIMKSNGKPKIVHYFELKDHISKKIKLIVIDEGSMVEKKMAEDLLSFGIPVVVLGDLNQLPPVFGKPYFLVEPNVILRQIMRQAEGNPIIWLSQQILNNGKLKIGVYGTSSVIPKENLTEYHFRNNDIILTGTNRLRYNINNYCREQIKGIKRLEYPHVGEKVVCRKNNWNMCIDNNLYLTNGITGFVDFIYRDSFNKKTMKMDFRPDFTKKVFKNVVFDYNHMYSVPGDDASEQTPMNFLYDKMEYAYAITTFTSQGSQWDNVIYLHEDYMRDPEDRKKLMYTAITRAVNSVTVVI